LVRQADEIAQLTNETEENLQKAYPNRRRPYFTTGRKGTPHSDLVQLYLDKIGSELKRPELPRFAPGSSILFSVTILPNGSVGSVEIHENSGGPELEKALRHAIESAAPFQEFPAEIAEMYSYFDITRRVGVREEAESESRDLEYKKILHAALDARWNRSSAPEGVRCKVQIYQLPGGEIFKVDFTSCPFDADSRRRLEADVRSSPLPYGGYENAFLRTFDFSFCRPVSKCNQSTE
jgi:hypothetical protein